jgi:hypothetical protein
MKRLFVPFLAMATLFFLGSAAYAQRGRGPGGTPGASGGMGAGASNGNASSHSGSGNSGNAGNIEAGKKSPDQLLSQNTKLSGNLGKLLPNGVTPQQACDGFKNLGQCVAAIHVSHNLGLDFNALKCDMTGKADTPTATCPTTTSTKKLSLGQSITALDPNADSKTESQKAMNQANQDIKDGSGS